MNINDIDISKIDVSTVIVLSLDEFLIPPISAPFKWSDFQEQLDKAVQEKQMSIEKQAAFLLALDKKVMLYNQILALKNAPEIQAQIIVLPPVDPNTPEIPSDPIIP